MSVRIAIVDDNSFLIKTAQEKLSFLNNRYNQMQGLASQGLAIAGSQAAKIEKNPFSGLFKKKQSTAVQTTA